MTGPTPSLDTFRVAPSATGTAVDADRPRYPGRLRLPCRTDGAAIHGLIAQCPPLDLNSVYAYLLLCEHFSNTCVVAEGEDAQLDGFVSAYLPPGRPDVLFVWQVAVHARTRGQGLGRTMLSHLLDRPSLAGVEHVETTVGPDNAASRRMFAALARSRGAGCREQALFEPHLFGGAAHEDERLLSIGPLRAAKSDRG